MFINYAVFRMNETKILDIIEKDQRTLNRYMNYNEYGSMDVQHYEPLFNLYESTIQDEKKRVEILWRTFSMPDQCRCLHYDDIKNIIIDTLHTKCMSKRKRKSLTQSVDVTKRICNSPLNHDEER